MGLSLETKTAGGADNAFQWLLHNSGIALATGFQVSLGEGSETLLWISSTGVGVKNPAGAVSVFVSVATATRILTLPDATGTVELKPLLAVLSAEVANSTVTAAAVTGLTAALAASTTYEFEAILLARSAATTTGVQVELTGPTGETEVVAYEINLLTGTTLSTSNRNSQLFSAYAANMANLGTAAADTTFPILVKGMLRTTSTPPATPLGFSFRSEIAASEVKIMPGSFLRVRKLA